MDRYIFEQFITQISEEQANDFFKYLIVNAQKKIDTKKKRYLLYYPQESEEIELIVETKKDKKGKLTIQDFTFHHKSNQEWEFKVVKSMNKFRNTYIVNRKDDTGTTCIRLVKEDILPKELTPGSLLKAQVCGIVMLANIFDSEEDYKKSIPADEQGNKIVMHDGSLIAYNLFINNSAKLSEEERKNRNHTRDNLLTFKSKLKNVEEKEVSMFDLELPNYYKATIDTTYGELDIIVPSSLVRKQPKDNNIIVGELLLTGNVCIDKFTKLIKDNTED